MFDAPALAPHQAALLDTFFSPSCGRVVLLNAGPGLGKSSALVALAVRLLREQPGARVLFLVPVAALRSQFAARLESAGVPVRDVDRYRFREMLDSASGGNPWAQASVVVVAQDLAKQPDVRSSLVQAGWDLVVADEAHAFRGVRGELLEEIGRASQRVLLATATPTVDLREWFQGDATTVVEWRREDIQAAIRRRNEWAHGVLSRPSLSETRFALTPSESQLADTVASLSTALASGGARERFLARLLLSGLRSSPAALEGTLRRLKASPTEAVLDEGDEEESGGDEDSSVEPLTTDAVMGLTDQALEELEELGSDSKLVSLGALLTQLQEPERRICIVTQFVATLYYLGAEMESLAMESRLVHGGTTAEDRQRRLQGFSADGGVLIVSSAVPADEVTFGEVTDLVLYDIAGVNSARLESLVGRFDRLERATPLTVHVVLSAGEADGPTTESLQVLRGVLGTGTTAEGRQASLFPDDATTPLAPDTARRTEGDS